MITLNDFMGKRNEVEQGISFKEPTIEIEEVVCLLEKPYEKSLSDETKKYSFI